MCCSGVLGLWGLKEMIVDGSSIEWDHKTFRSINCSITTFISDAVVRQGKEYRKHYIYFAKNINTNILSGMMKNIWYDCFLCCLVWWWWLALAWHGMALSYIVYNMILCIYLGYEKNWCINFEIDFCKWFVIQIFLFSSSFSDLFHLDLSPSSRHNSNVKIFRLSCVSFIRPISGSYSIQKFHRIANKFSISDISLIVYLLMEIYVYFIWLFRYLITRRKQHFSFSA